MRVVKKKYCLITYVMSVLNVQNAVTATSAPAVMIVMRRRTLSAQLAINVSLVAVNAGNVLIVRVDTVQRRTLVNAPIVIAVKVAVSVDFVKRARTHTDQINSVVASVTIALIVASVPMNV